MSGGYECYGDGGAVQPYEALPLLQTQNSPLFYVPDGSQAPAWLDGSPAMSPMSLLSLDGALVPDQTEALTGEPLQDMSDTRIISFLNILPPENNKLGGNDPGFAGMPADYNLLRPLVAEFDGLRPTPFDSNGVPLETLISDVALVPGTEVSPATATLAAPGETPAEPTARGGRRRGPANGGRSRQSRPTPISADGVAAEKPRRRPRKPKVYEIAQPLEDAEMERKRLNAINAKKNREEKKKKSEDMKSDLDSAVRERDELLRELEDMKHREEQLRTELERKGVTFPCL